MALTVQDLLQKRVSIVLQDIDANNLRWSNEEKLQWLNEAYEKIVSLRPDANSVNEEFSPENSKSKQSIPAGGLRFLDVIRNTAPTSDGYPVTPQDMDTMDQTERGWHRSDPDVNIEHYIFNDKDPMHFYLYPRPTASTSIEILYSKVPDQHDTSDYDAVKGNAINLPDSYAPAIVDWILYRSFSKDADHQANFGRAQSSHQAFHNALGVKIQTDRAYSPNAKEG